MRALTWQGTLDVRVTDVPDPRIQEPSDAVIAVTSTAICGSDLHLYGVLGPYLCPGDVLGHETMGVVTEVGADITNLAPGDRPEDVAGSIPCGDSVDAVAEAAGAFFKAGFTDLALVQIGGTEPEQDRFLAAAPELITALKETAG